MLSLALVAIAGPLRAQQDGLVAFPNVYRVQFENEWVRLVRVSLPAGATLAAHAHPPGVMLHIYFNDADPVLFQHDGAPYDVTRPAVKTRSYRIGRATPETHSVLNFGGASDYMRVELKTQGSEALLRRIGAPPLTNQTDSVVEVVNPQYRATRVTIAAGGTFMFATSAAEPTLLIALTSGVVADSAGAPKPVNVGDDRFIAPGRRDLLRNAGTEPVQFLRVDFLTRPQ
jgi:hypothetical protein